MTNHGSKKQLPFLDMIWYYKYWLVLYFVIVSFATFSVLYLLDYVPDEFRVTDELSQVQVMRETSLASYENQPAGTSTTRQSGSTKSGTESATKPTVGTNRTNPTQTKTQTETMVSIPEPVGQYPVWIIIDKIGVNTSVSNPASTSTSVLNAALLKGAVRYPGSGVLGSGNMFVFGHSTGIRVVNNQAYKTFNHLGMLSAGDMIRVRSVDHEYVYKVTSVSLVDSSKELVSFSKKQNMLTLSTCNVFGEKQERFVVEASFETSVLLR